MPYSPDKPPDQIKALPKDAQAIWIAAFNSAYESFDPAQTTIDSREGYASAVAWAAVKNAGYEKDDKGEWVKKDTQAWERGGKRPFAFDPNSTKNEGRFRLLPPSAIMVDGWGETTYFREKSKTPGVSYVKGENADGEIVIQAIRFDRAMFTEEQAKAWWNEHKDEFQFADMAQAAKAALPYHPEKMSDVELMAEWRIVKDSRFAIPLLTEILKRGTVTFDPEGWEDDAKELYLKAFAEVITEPMRFIYMPESLAGGISKSLLTAVIDVNKRNLDEFHVLKQDDSILGYVRCRAPKRIDLNEFQRTQKRHGISHEERKQLWPDAREFYLYEIRDFIPLQESVAKAGELTCDVAFLNPCGGCETGECLLCIRKAASEHIVYGVVYEPYVVDSQGDFASPEEIEKAAHLFAEKYQEFNIEHEGTYHKVALSESYVAPEDIRIGGQPVKKGSWILAVRIPDILWGSIEKGEINGYSMEGGAVRSPGRLPGRVAAQVSANELSDMVIRKVALVKFPANRRAFLLRKSDDKGGDQTMGKTKDELEAEEVEKKKKADEEAAVAKAKADAEAKAKAALDAEELKGVLTKLRGYADKLEDEALKKGLQAIAESLAKVLGQAESAKSSSPMEKAMIAVAESIAETLKSEQEVEGIEKRGAALSALSKAKIEQAISVLQELLKYAEGSAAESKEDGGVTKTEIEALVAEANKIVTVEDFEKLLKPAKDRIDKITAMSK